MDPFVQFLECTFWSTSSWGLSLALLFLSSSWVFLYLLCCQGDCLIVFYNDNDFQSGEHNFYAVVYLCLIKCDILM